MKKTAPMLTLKVRVNTFVKNKEDSSLDTISKLYILVETLCGLNRIFIVKEYNKRIKIALTIVGLLVGLVSVGSAVYVANLTHLFPVVEYLCSTMVSCITHKRLQQFYLEIDYFDKHSGYRPSTSQILRYNIYSHVFEALASVSIIILFYLRGITVLEFYNVLYLYVHIFELFFYGHVYSVISLRMQFINVNIDSALSITTRRNPLKTMGGLVAVKQWGHKDDVKDLNYYFDLFIILDKVFRKMKDAIKWQFLISIAFSLSTNIAIFHKLMLSFIRNHINMDLSTRIVVMYLCLLLGNTLPLFSCCLSAHYLHNEVARLRTSVSSRLYQNKMDKSSRIAARALLALTKECNLSLILLGMVQVDISLPFKYISLVLNYLIILVQFQKVLES